MYFENSQPSDMIMNIIIDTQVFPGNSGGSVVNGPETMSINGTNSNPSANFVGIVCAYNAIS